MDLSASFDEMLKVIEQYESLEAEGTDPAVLQSARKKVIQQVETAWDQVYENKSATQLERMQYIKELARIMSRLHQWPELDAQRKMTSLSLEADQKAQGL